MRTTPLPPSVIALEDLERLYTELNTKTLEALRKHLAGLPQPPEIGLVQFEALKKQVMELANLTVTVQGAHGEQIAGTTGDILNRAHLPDVISWIAFDSAAVMRWQNVTLLNRFTLHLDFTEPPGFHSYNPWDQSTPNSSKLEVIGDDHTWVTAVYESALEFFRRRRRRRAWLHSHQSFNALNWLIGFPGALWVIYRIDSGGALSRLHPALKGAIYVYLFLVALLIFRGIIWGFRWMFPVLELEGARTKRTRAILSTVLTSILLALVYDVLRTLFW